MFKIKRIYEAAEAADGYRVLVDRLWPRGVAKEKAHVNLWLKDVAPSNALRKWFGHEPERWAEFQERYRQELKGNTEVVHQLTDLRHEHGTVTLLYAAGDEKHNQALALQAFLQKRK